MSRDVFSTAAPVDDPYGEQAHARQQDEERRERDWLALETAASDFVQTYGAAAMLRCVSRALEGQGSLLK